MIRKANLELSGTKRQSHSYQKRSRRNRPWKQKPLTIDIAMIGAAPFKLVSKSAETFYTSLDEVNALLRRFQEPTEAQVNGVVYGDNELHIEL